MITTEEGNKLIAKFDDVTVYGIFESDGNPLRASFHASQIEMFEKMGYKIQLSYHFDWNALMKVVQKINEPYKFKIIDEVDTNEWYTCRRLFDLSITSSILEVWNAVVNFIIWYNEKNKS